MADVWTPFDIDDDSDWEPTEEELDMNLFDFIDKATAEEGLPQSVADEYKRAFSVALGLPTSDPKET